MKTTIYGLLGMIKDDNIPQRIIFKDQIYEYVKSAEDYYNEELGYMFDVYVLKSILNDEVEILEATITYKPDKIEPLEYEEIKMCNDDIVYDKIISFDNEKLVLKINEIIEVLNER